MAEMPPKLTVEGKGNAAVARTKLLHSRPLHSTDFSVLYISLFFIFDTTDFSALFFIFRPLDFRQNSPFCVFFFFSSLILPF